MKIHILFLFALCGMLLPLATQARSPAIKRPPLDALYNLPSTNTVVKYEYSPGSDEWLAVSKTDGEIVLTCLRNIDKLETWVPTVNCPSVSLNKPRITLPAMLGFRFILTDGSTNILYMSTNGEYFERFAPGYEYPARLAIPDEQRKTLSQIFNTWYEAYVKKITSQPLPCQFRVGSFKGGDTLSGIARLFYGDATKWPVIYEANKAAIKNPDIINHGMVITVPKLETTPP